MFSLDLAAPEQIIGYVPAGLLVVASGVQVGLVARELLGLTV